MNKDDLIKMAEERGLDSSGTKAEIRSRIEGAKSTTVLAPSEEISTEEDPEDEPEEDLEEISTEEDPEEKSLQEAPGSEPTEKLPEPAPPRAVLTSAVVSEETAVACKTCVKYVAGWRHLVAGKRIAAPSSVISMLRNAKLVE